MYFPHLHKDYSNKKPGKHLYRFLTFCTISQTEFIIYKLLNSIMTIPGTDYNTIQ